MAGSTTSPLETVPSTDQSVHMLDTLFGAGWPDILSGTSPPGSLMFDIFSAFNSVSLAIVSVMMFYTVLAGTVGTAHEGEPLGKRYSTLWTPIRAATAVSMLMPLPWAKLSLLQAIVLKFVFLGIGGADFVTGKAVDYMAAHCGKITAEAASPDVQKAAEAAFMNLLVIAYAQEIEGRAAGAAPSASASTTGEIMAQFPAPDGIPQEDMGYISVTCRGYENICDVRQAEAGKLVEVIRTAAQAIVSRHDGGADDTPDMAAVSRAIDAYGAAVKNAIREKQAAMDPSTQMTAFASGVKARGWASLGSWYWTLAGYNERANAMQVGEISAREPNLERISRMFGGTFGDYVQRAKGFAKRLDEARSIDHAESLASGGDGTDGIGEMLSRKLAGHFADLGANAVSLMSDGDPVANMQSLGHMMIDTGSVGLVLLKAISARLPDTGDKSGDAKGGPLNWVAGKVASAFLPTDMLGGLASIMTTALWVLLFAGIGLAYYLPAVPFVLWTMAVAGWLVQIVEAMFAMPVWAAAHAIPEGEGLAGQHGRQGYMILLGVLARPALMVAGFFAAFLCMGVIGSLVGDGYQVFTAGAVGGTLTDGHTSGGWAAAGGGAAAGAVAGGPWGAAAGAVALPVGIGMIGLLASMLVGAGIVMVAVHKVFALITWLPDHVLKWAGAASASASMDEHGSEGRIAAIFSRSVQQGQAGLGGGPGALMGIGGQAKKELAGPGAGKRDDAAHAPGKAE